MNSETPQSDSFLNISRQQTHLQGTLQQLLDAQSEGLLAGLAKGSPQKDTRFTRSGHSTPTFGSESRHGLPKSTGIVPIRQPAKRKVGLRGARRGISQAISDLAVLKRQEEEVLEDELSQREEVLSNIQSISHRCTGLKDQISNIESEDISHQIGSLRKEEMTLDHEIHETETKLWEMKARQRLILRDIEGLSNSVESRLSSYTSALALAQKQTRLFLSKPPLHEGRPIRAAGMWSLPVERRTLEMAQDQYSEEQEGLRKQLLSATAEKEALEKGLEVWSDVLRVVDSVEKLLSDEMQRMQSPPLTAVSDRKAAEGMKRVLMYMPEAQSLIESKLVIAEDRDWKLLVCCIGAELEAMIEGQRVLQAAFEASEAGDGGEELATNETEAGLPDSQGSRSRTIKGSDQQVLLNKSHDRLNKSEDEDDGPDPDLLISNHDGQ